MKNTENRLDLSVLEKKKSCFTTKLRLEKHEHTAMKAERIRNSKYWVISINAEGPQLPRQQRPDYAAAKGECQRLQDEFMAGTKQLHKPIHPGKQMCQNPNQQFEVKNIITFLSGKTGWKWYKEQQGELPHTSSSSSSSWQKSS